jgi:hypothetical protein
MRKNIEIIALIYKSTAYLESIISEMRSSLKVEDWDISYRVIANDASEKILKALEKSEVDYSIYNDQFPDDYYLNRVYRCWNYAGKTSKADNICFVNSDMIFAEGWLKNLLDHHNGINIPTSRLIESGKMPSGRYGISANCGQTLNSFNRTCFDYICDEVKENSAEIGGLYMPCIFEKERFIDSGMFPEGNIYQDGVGTLGTFVESGDSWFFRRLEEIYGMKHITVFNSLVYHFQEGEKDE